MTGPLQMLSHPQGAIVVGWVAPSVIYARFVEAMPAPLAIRYAFHLEKMLQSASSVRYFGDCSELETYEHDSGASVRSVFRMHRLRLASIDLLLPNRAMELVALTFSATLGGALVHVLDRSAFQAKLISAAPGVEHALNPRTWQSVPPVSIRAPSKRDAR